MTKNSRNRSKEAPLNPPDPPLAAKLHQLAGDRTPDDQDTTAIDQSAVADRSELTATDVYEGDLEIGTDQSSDNESLDELTELELRSEETDDPSKAVEEGYTYIPPIDPPTVPAGAENAEIASGLGSSALDEPYDANHHSSFLSADDEVSARVREALRADSSTTEYADRITITTRDNVVTLSGLVDDLLDNDNLLAVAGYVEGVEEVVDELRVRGIE